MTLITDRDLPLQDPRLPPTQLPDKINPIRYGFTMAGVEALRLASTFETLVAAQSPGVEHFLDGMFNEGVQSSASMTDESFEALKKAYPGISVGRNSSKEQVVAALNRRQLEDSADFFGRMASPGLASTAAGFLGENLVGLADAPALIGAKAAYSLIGKSSRVLADSLAESAVSRLGGNAALQAQQLIANNAGKIAFAQTTGAVSAFGAIQDVERFGIPALSGVTTPNEDDYRVTDSILNMIVGASTFGVLGGISERFTGKLVDKSVFKTREQKAAESQEARAYQQQQRADLVNNIQQMTVEPGDPLGSLKKVAKAIDGFFKQNSPESEQNLMDNASMHLELGREVTDDFLIQVQSHEAWKSLQQHIDEQHLTPEEFANTLKELRPELLKAVEEGGGDINALNELAMNETLIEMAQRSEADMMPKQTTKQAYIDNIKENKIDFDDKPDYDFDEIPKQRNHTERLNEVIESRSPEELQLLVDTGNPYAQSALRRMEVLEAEPFFTDFVKTFGNDIANFIRDGAELREQDINALRDILKDIGASDEEINFVADHLDSLIRDLINDMPEGAKEFTPEQLEQAAQRQFELIRAQVVRAMGDAKAFEHKMRVMKNAIEQMGDKEGQGIKQGLIAILDRSLFQFAGANEGTYRKMNVAERYFKSTLQRKLAEHDVLEFFNDTNSSVELGLALEADSLGKDMSDFSEPARISARIINEFYRKAIDELARVGVLISELPGRIHYKWNNPHRMLKLTRKERRGKSHIERINQAFENWYQFKIDRLDLEKTFGRQREHGEPGIDINDKAQVKEAMRRTFDKIVNPQTYKDPVFSDRGRANLLNRRNRERIYHFKTPQDFIEYNARYGGGTTQNSIMNELTGMFREAELIRDWGVEPEAMLAEVKERAKDMPGWREYQLREKKDMDTPERLMRLMRFGAAQTFGTFGETIRNIKSWEAITKLGNLWIMNFTDSLTASNALNRVGLPMFESITQGIKETFARYTPEEKDDYLRMFSIGREQYFGAQFRHYEGDGLNNTLQKAIRLSMKITGTENSEYSNTVMVGKMLSNHLATQMERIPFNDLIPETKATLGRYSIGEPEWNLLKNAITEYKGNKYIEWDSVADLSDDSIRTYLHEKGVKKATKGRITEAREDITQRFRLLMQDQFDDAVNRRSLTEWDLIRLQRRPDQPDVINDVINGAMLFKTYGFLWIRRHIGDRLYGKGADSYRVSSLQGTADWHGLVKLLGMSFAMEYAISQIKELTNKGEFQPLTGKTAFDAFTSSLGPIAYLTDIDASNLTSSAARILGGPIAGDVDRIARIVSQYERGFWKGDYTTAQVNTIKMIQSQFGGVPGLKAALNALIFDNMIQNRKGHRTGTMIDKLQAAQPEGQTP